MGIETLVLVGLSLFQASAAMSQAEDQADAAIREGDLRAKEKAKETRLRAARQKVSFLNSGLTLDGTPIAAINNTFDVGLEDVNQIQENSRIKAKNIIKSGRTEAIGKIAGTVAPMFGGAGGGESAFAGLPAVNNQNQQWDWTDNFSTGARADKGYADEGGFGPYRF